MMEADDDADEVGPDVAGVWYGRGEPNSAGDE